MEVGFTNPGLNKAGSNFIAKLILALKISIEQNIFTNSIC